MNKERRAEIDRIIRLLENASALIEEAKGAAEDVSSEEQEYYDNMPESLQGGEKGDMATEAVSNLDSAVSEAEAIDLDSIVGYLESAKG